MSTLHHEDLLLSIFEEVQEAFPYLDEEKQIEIANNRPRSCILHKRWEVTLHFKTQTVHPRIIQMTNLEWDAQTVMEQIHMAESRHMQMGALCSYLLQYPDMTIRDFFAMASEEIREQEEEEGYYEWLELNS